MLLRLGVYLLGCYLLGLMSEVFDSQWGLCLARILACSEGMGRKMDGQSERERPGV